MNDIENQITELSSEDLAKVSAGLFSVLSPMDQFIIIQKYNGYCLMCQKKISETEAVSSYQIMKHLEEVHSVKVKGY